MLLKELQHPLKAIVIDDLGEVHAVWPAGKPFVRGRNIERLQFFNEPVRLFDRDQIIERSVKRECRRVVPAEVRERGPSFVDLRCLLVRPANKADGEVM